MWKSREHNVTLLCNIILFWVFFFFCPKGKIRTTDQIQQTRDGTRFQRKFHKRFFSSNHLSFSSLQFVFLLQCPNIWMWYKAELFCSLLWICKLQCCWDFMQLRLLSCYLMKQLISNGYKGNTLDPSACNKCWFTGIKAIASQ